jgi:transcriptional regulator with XRE-family HTH domain
MRPRDLRAERLKLGWGQGEAARRLGVSQPYLSLLERGKRRLTAKLMRRATSVYGLSPGELPVSESFMAARGIETQRLGEYLSRLDYPGFAYVRSHLKKKNPGEVLLAALGQGKLEARVAEALPWLLLRYWRMDFDWLAEEAKRSDLQNRLGFVVSLARRLSERTAEIQRTDTLLNLETTLGRIRLACEDYFPRPPRDDIEREWLMQNRPEEARYWNLLSDLRAEHLQYAEQ